MTIFFKKKPFKSIPSRAVLLQGPTTPVQTLMLCLINELKNERHFFVGDLISSRTCT